MEIPPDILLKLKCDECENYLSSSPVFLREDDKRICACCATPDDKIQITPYEELAKLVVFPCKNKKYGCQQTLPFNDESDHENICEFRETTCPFLEHGNCDWLGGNNDIFNHCYSEHKEKVLLNITEYEICTEIFEFFLISAFEKLFTLRLKIAESSGIIFHALSCLDESADLSDYKYNLNVPNKSIKHIKISSDMKKISLKKKLSSFEIELKLNCISSNKNISILLYNDGPSQNRWSKQYEECKITCSNCNFIDIKTKVDKHESHFCKDGRWCEICTQNITESTREEHRSRDHCDIILENGVSWKTLLSKERKWRIISSDVGELLCSYEIGLSGLDVRIITPLTRRQLTKYSCIFEICGYEIKKTMDVQKDDHIDWHTHIDEDELNTDFNEEFTFLFKIIRNE